MIPLRHQRTVARAASVEGFGYWSGEDCRVEFRPAAPGSGVTFVLAPANGAPPTRFPVGLSFREDRPRRTVMKNGDKRVEMIEHVMAALFGLEIDNCEVWVTAEEMPGCDGSAAAFVEALDMAGVVVQSTPTRPLVVTRATRVGNEHKWIEAQPTNSNGLSIEFHLDYGPSNAIGRQSFAAEISPEQFRYELAAARTFVLREEADALVAMGKGTRVTPQDLLIFDADGPMENPLRYPDECVRHKVLDVVGDLALAGRPIVGHIVGYRSGHQLNAELVEALLAHEQEVGQRKSA
ncbi:UDP-3-O-acyl-N-acetylglucosamine deacetylase [Aeoliella mucimassa]|uniref:UDP-3-O-acyl-N-acetylglucosamine deacetylase n=1 Tax=Aeoliella mucimassa TaxID=2527972 RepID=A0A518ARC8_9BACT|nr:UDP-3-O-acyl-N-acetylglucosamine deacetylase [Aeoliella mucimassa]QDU57265.1 UDP-3-O-[3-hydroxymyristoyl] N-acetylglucosamine deacetylase [Aeoliella mucimassa]